MFFSIVCTLFIFYKSAIFGPHEDEIERKWIIYLPEKNESLVINVFSRCVFYRNRGKFFSLKYHCNLWPPTKTANYEKKSEGNTRKVLYSSWELSDFRISIERNFITLYLHNAPGVIGRIPVRSALRPRKWLSIEHIIKCVFFVS